MIAFGLWLAPLLLALQPTPPNRPVELQPPRFNARLLAAQESVAPGAEVELAVELDIGKPWHIYHPIILDTGLATKIVLSGPPSARVGDLRYPPPLIGEQVGIRYLEHSGRFCVLTTLRVAADAKPGTTIDLRVDVSGLACIEACVPVEASAALSLPVAATTAAAANERVFAEARMRVMKNWSAGPYLNGSEARLSAEKLKLNEPAELIASVKIEAGHHIQDRDPGVEGLIATQVFVESLDGVDFGDAAAQVWPTAKTRDMPGIGKVRELSGDAQIRIPLKIVDTKFPSGPVTLRVLLQYQACTDAGQCYAPEMVETFVRFVADTPNPPDEKRSAYRVLADGAGAALQPKSSAPGDAERSYPLYLALIFAFLGGLILNVMPCVLPVISLKILSFVQQGGENPGRVLRLGLAFCAGIMVWFWIFAVLSMTGNLPLQYPEVVIGVGSLLFLMALNLFGIFELMLPGDAAGKLDELSAREGYGGAFLKGLLATLLGTACTAPFLAGALVYAATQPRIVAFLVFTAAGFGMALPYLLLVARPGWLKFVPKPGVWMVTFKQATGFVVLGAAVWLLWVLGSQLGANGVVWTVCFWLFLGLAAWMWGMIRFSWSDAARLQMRVAALLVVGVGFWFSYRVMYKPETRTQATADIDAIVRQARSADWSQGIPWAHYQKGLAAQLASKGYTVYVDYTASWCVTCQANKAAVLETDAIRGKLRAMGVIPIEADFSNRDAEMLAEIVAFGRPSVPLNLIYPANRPDDVIVLPVLLTSSVLTAELDRAGASSVEVALP